MPVLSALQEHGLDLDQLLGPGQYKEQYRTDMIRWGEARRRQDPGFFCRLATRGARQPVWVRERALTSALAIWIHVLLLAFFLCSHSATCSLIGQVVSDARRLSDLQWFWSRFPQQTRTVRVQSSEETRKQRGWSFTAGEISCLSAHLSALLLPVYLPVSLRACRCG